MISNDLIRDTLNLVTLAREAAMAQGEQEQANRLSLVIEGLHDLVTSGPRSQPESHVLNSDVNHGSKASFSATLSELGQILTPQTQPARSKAVTDLVESGMLEIDIARQLGIAREQVRLITSLHQQSQSGWRHEND